jgi:two-component system, NtrC family, sensor kinase
MKSYKNLAINTKLTLLVLLTGGMAVLLSCIGFVANDVPMIRSSMVQQISALATVLGSNSAAALTFQDPKTAAELLTSLRLQPAIEFACIYDASGKAFATYRHSSSTSPPGLPPAEPGWVFNNQGYLDVTQQIEQNGQVIGRIFLRTSMAELHHQMLRYVSIAAIVMIVSLGSSILISSRLQRVISVPILRLAGAAQRVSIERNYAVRVTKSANDELGTLYDQFNAMLDQIQQGEAAIQQAHDELEIKVEQRTAELSRANEDLSREVTERLRAEEGLEIAHQELMVSARRAGMAEIATGVLHNVGNVLNSINVSATLVADRMRQSKAADFMRATHLMEQHADDLATFMTSDPKGKQLPGFLALLANHFSDERAEIVKELELLTTKVGHVKTIIATQQSYAGVSGVIEIADIGTMLDDAVKLNSASFDRHRISIFREYLDIPKVHLDKQKVLQILINLLNNAREAFGECPDQTDRKLSLRTMLDQAGQLSIHISDNAVGIPPENLTRIFSHGYTTKKTGHGFGLHSCANAADELGGSLSVHSDGIGKGATFVLKLPYHPVEILVEK